MTGKALSALVFDAYGTLFDVHSVIALCEELWPDKGEALSRVWRAKQLEYTWLRSLMRRYVTFDTITAESLRYACASLGLECSNEKGRRLLDAYLRLATFPEVSDTLETLKRKKIKLAILSNGSPAMLRPLVKNAGLSKMFQAVISVDELEIYKPTSAVYKLSVNKLGVPKNAIGFVSSNCWDACGAKAFGFTTFWVNRSGAPVDQLSVTPDEVIRDLAQLPTLIRSI
jgi:2-haloacid dehalogenase